MDPHAFADETDEAIKRLMYYAPWMSSSVTPKQAGSRAYAVVAHQQRTWARIEFSDLLGTFVELSFGGIQARGRDFMQHTREWVIHLWRYDGADASAEVDEVDAQEKVLRLMLMCLMMDPDFSPEQVVHSVRTTLAGEPSAATDAVLGLIQPNAAMEAHRRFHASQMGRAYRALIPAWDRAGATREQRVQEWRDRMVEANRQGRL